MKISVEKIEYESLRGEVLALRGSIKAERERAEEKNREAIVATEANKALLVKAAENLQLSDALTKAGDRISRLWFVVGFEAVAFAAVAGALVLELLGGS